MILGRFTGMLREAGFSLIQSNLREISIYYKVYGQCVYIFNVVYFQGEIHLDSQQFKNIVCQITESFYRREYREVQLLSIIFTENMNHAKRIIADNQSVWFIDLISNQLIVYENQPTDFIGIRKPIENMLYNSLEQAEKKKYSFGAVNTILIVVNIIAFLVTDLKGNTTDANYMLKCGAMYVPYLLNKGEFYRLFTSMFLHFGISHLSGNMLTLAFLGDNLERAFGWQRYCIIYLFSGLGASMCSFLYNVFCGREVVAAGASGAIFGVIGALLYTLYQNHGKLQDLRLGRLILLVMFILYNGFTTQGIDNAAHIGGLLIGVLLAIVLYPGNGTVKEREQRK